MTPGRRFAAAALLAGLSASAHAFTVERFSPLGDAARVNQVRARFSEPMVKFGQQDLPAPFEVSCPEQGTGRWLNAREWVFDFRRVVPPGTRCSFRLARGLKALAGSAASGPATFAFATGGPAVVQTRPYSGERVDEEQVFALVLNGPVREETVAPHAACQAEGVAERIPVATIGGEERAAILKHLRLADNAGAVLLRCKQRLPAGAKLVVTWGRGIEALRDGRPSGIVTRVEQRFEFRVRPEFTASMSCERERAGAPCVPVSPVRLAFTIPVERRLAERIVLRTPQGERRPSFGSDERDNAVETVQFKGPLPGLAELALEMPAGFVSVEGKPLANAGSFPLRFRTGDLPPLLKFPAASFGIVEAGPEASLPLTVRHVEPAFAAPGAAGAAAGEVRWLRLDDERAVIEWFRRVREYDETTLVIDRKEVRSRERSLLGGRADAQRARVPAAAAERRPFEVIGVPLPGPGYYVLEAASRRLGAALLGKDEPMYVRTSALVTNLAVHAKFGQENALVWVTTLDRGRPAAGAEVRIRDCRGEELWRGVTGADGAARVERRFGEPLECPHALGWFVSARTHGAAPDFSFAWSRWNDGIEPWRFEVPYAWDRHEQRLRAHTVLDRPLYRAGETVSMKHFLRTESMRGLELVGADRLPGEVTLRHVGSGDEFKAPVEWSGARTGLSRFALPAAAKKGRYEIALGPHGAGSFRVEDFRLPVFTGSIAALAPGIGVRELPVSVAVRFTAGGAAKDLPVRVSALLERSYASFEGWRGFSFQPDADERTLESRLVADKEELKLDAQGTGKLVIRGIPAFKHRYELVTEATFADPGGETQTLSRRLALWPAAVVVGIKAEGWTSFARKARVQLVVLDTAGKPQAGRTVALEGRLRQYFTHRKRVVGGFYAYEHRSETEPLGRLCEAQTDARGLAFCELELKRAGNVELIASSADDAGRRAEAHASVWVTEHGELWFDVDSHDRMDVIPEKRAYAPGDTARFQVRMPFRDATALVAIEREGVIETRVERLSGSNPVLSVPVKGAWAPNVYVSVLAVRGRIRETPWYSLFTWGWRAPLEWWDAFWNERPLWQPPTALVDLAKPAFRFGVAAIEVGRTAHELKVAVTPEKSEYAPRQTARVRLRVLAPDGKPAPAGTEVAVAAVDQALLELQPNRSWELLDALLQKRAWGVETSSAQLQVIGKRHYGRKALPPGGGGGQAPTRELFDTLLAWQPRVALDAAGEATVEVPLNDSLTTFTVAAVADAGASLFGTGQARFRSNQDLQVIAGLPPLVRETDRFAAGVTLRNTTKRAMQVKLEAKLGGKPLEARTVALEPEGSAGAEWTVEVPRDAERLDWELEAAEQGGGGARDRVRLAQRVVPAVPVTVRQAELVQVEGRYALAAAPPAEAQADAAGRVRGGLAVTLAPRLGGELPGVRRFFERYPFVCLEQKASKALGLRSRALWDTVMRELPTYLDRDGLAAYFPLGEGAGARGSDVLTAHLVAAAHETGFEIPAASLERMLRALQLFADGRLKREHWAPRRDSVERRLAALEALSRHGRVRGLVLTSLEVAPELWPTSAIVNWRAILARTPDAPQREARLKEADNHLRTRLSYQGTRLVFSSERTDYLWWLMVNGDVDAARLALGVMREAGWRDELPRLLLGLLGRQQRHGAWSTTTANLWGSLAVERFGEVFEKDAVAGRSRAALGPGVLEHAWKGDEKGTVALGTLAWGARPAAGGTLEITHEGAGKPWATILSLAALELRAPVAAGYRVSKSAAALEQKQPGAWSRGDVVRVTLSVQADADMSWVVVSDPVPAGATLLGSGLGRDSAIASAGERRTGRGWLAYVERSFEAWRAYYAYLPRGTTTIEYTLRLNNPGEFALPPTRVEAMYAPEMFGEAPNARLEVRP